MTFEPIETTTTDVFHAVLGTKAIKCDAFWHLFEWLLTPNEGHGLGDSIQVQLIAFTFGQSFAECKIKREYPVSGQTDGKGRYADLVLGIPTLVNPTHVILLEDISSGQLDKLERLKHYISLLQNYHSDAARSAVVVSRVSGGNKLPAAVYKVLGEPDEEFIAVTGWRLLPLHTIGTWVKNAMNARQNLSDKMKFVLEDLVEWCG